MNHFPTNGSREQVSAVNRGITSSNRNETEDWSVVIYDNLRNLVTETLLSDPVPEKNLKREVFKSNTGDCQIINKVHKNQDTVIWRASATEIENNSDTNCSEANFRPISFT